MVFSLVSRLTKTADASPQTFNQKFLSDGSNDFQATASVDSGGNLINPAQDGTDATGISPPAGAVGIRGWLSSIYGVTSGTLKTSEVAPTPVLSASTTSTFVTVKNTACKFISFQATNNSTMDYGYAVICDLTAPPLANAAISPRKWAKLPLSDGTPQGVGTTDLNEIFNCVNGSVILLTTSLTNYTPATMNGLISGSAI